MRFRRFLPILLVAGLLPLTLTHAQFDKDYKSWYGHVAAGYSLADDSFGKAVDDGWELNGGATYKPASWPVGLIFDLGYSEYDIKDSALTDDNGDKVANSGDFDIWSLTAGGVWAPTSGGKVGFYLSGAIGAYRIEGKLTDPGTGCGWVCDPWYPYWCWWSCTSVDVVTGSKATTRMGGNIAAGLTFRVTSMGSTLYLECKYNYVDTTNKATTFVPITLGYRW